MERNAFLAMAGERERRWPRALLVLVAAASPRPWPLAA